jgi:hypothetical protein
MALRSTESEKSLGGHAPYIKKPETRAYPGYSVSSCKPIQPMQDHAKR